MDAQELYVRIGTLIGDMPNLMVTSDGTARWIAKAVALVEATGAAADGVQLAQYADRHANDPSFFGPRIIPIVLRSLERAELKAPATASGAFIPAGNALDAMAAVGKVLKTATTDTFIVDPYMDEVVLNDFAVMLPDGVSLRLLTDPFKPAASLKPAVQRWTAQYGSTRPVDARNTAPRALHDRLIVVDKGKAWTMSQSFAHLAARSPAMIMLVAPDIAALKIPAYEAMWASGTPL